MLPGLPHPIVFAHRGASAFAPENTLSAFRKALDDGALAVEFDVKLTADQEVVVLHDQTVDRTTNGKGDLRSFTLSALKGLDAGSWFDVKFREERIPTLNEVFEKFKNQLFLNIELTNYQTPNDGLVNKVVERVIDHGLQKHILFSSFNPDNLHEAGKLLPDTPRGLLIPELWRGRRARQTKLREEGYQAIHPFLMDVTPNLIKHAHASGTRVHVWTVNIGFVMRLLFRWGVDGIFTDNPALALRILRGRS